MKTFLILVSLVSLQTFTEARIPERSEIKMALDAGQTLKEAKVFLSLGDNWNDGILNLKCYVFTSFPYLGDLSKNPISFSASVKLDRMEAIDPDQFWGKEKYPANMYLTFDSGENHELKTNPLALMLFPIRDRFKPAIIGYRFASSALEDLYRLDPRVVLNYLGHTGVRKFGGTPLDTFGLGREIHSAGTKISVSIHEKTPFFFIETVGIYTDSGTMVYPYPEEKEAYSRSYVCQPFSL